MNMQRHSSIRREARSFSENTVQCIYRACLTRGVRVCFNCRTGQMRTEHNTDYVNRKP